jgi:hypothetical protein
MTVVGRLADKREPAFGPVPYGACPKDALRGQQAGVVCLPYKASLHKAERT